MNHTDSGAVEGARNLTGLRAFFCGLAAILGVIATTACTSPSPSKQEVPTADLDRFWSSADESVHDAQRSLRSARQVARQLGGEAAKGDYEQVIALGHRVGGLGHDHLSPADKPPVIPMLNSMAVAIDALLQVDSTPAELEEAQKATDADLSKLSPRAQRLYHLLRAKQRVLEVRGGATAIGFRGVP